LIDFQKAFTAAKSSKFPTKPTLSYPPHLKYVAALPWKTLKSELCTSLAHKTRFKCDFLSSVQQTKEMTDVIKMSAKIKTMQNINILLFVRSLSFTSLKLCSKARNAYRPSKHQHSKNLTR